jgi:hypothetical protein
MAGQWAKGAKGQHVLLGHLTPAGGFLLSIDCQPVGERWQIDHRFQIHSENDSGHAIQSAENKGKNCSDVARISALTDYFDLLPVNVFKKF